VLGDLGIDQPPAKRLQAFEFAFFIGAHQARIAAARIAAKRRVSAMAWAAHPSRLSLKRA